MDIGALPWPRGMAVSSVTTRPSSSPIAEPQRASSAQEFSTTKKKPSMKATKTSSKLPFVGCIRTRPRGKPHWHCAPSPHQNMGGGKAGIGLCHIGHRCRAAKVRFARGSCLVPLLGEAGAARTCRQVGCSSAVPSVGCSLGYHGLPGVPRDGSVQFFNKFMKASKKLALAAFVIADSL